ncbi:MAG: hypothetical protein R2909_06880 [Gemmatimonadales bacterium]
MDDFLRNAWVAFADRVWHHFATLTAKFPMTQAELTRAFRAYARNLERWLQRRVDYYGVFPENDRVLHLHALLHGTAGVTTGELESRWRRIAGNARVKCYRQGIGGPEYLAEHLRRRDNANNPFFSNHLPAPRPNGHFAQDSRAS